MSPICLPGNPDCDSLTLLLLASPAEFPQRFRLGVGIVPGVGLGRNRCADLLPPVFQLEVHFSGFVRHLK